MDLCANGVRYIIETAPNPGALMHWLVNEKTGTACRIEFRRTAAPDRVHVAVDADLVTCKRCRRQAE